MRLLARLLVGLVLIVASAAGALAFTAGPAAACSCASQDAQVLSEGADVVFSGVVAKRAERGDESVLTVRVDRVFKGEVRRRTDVVGGTNGSTCGLDPVEDDPVIIFGTRTEEAVSAGLCTSLHSLSGKGYQQALDDLGAGAAPLPGSTLVERPLGLSYEQFSAGRAILGAVGLLLMGYFAIRALRAWLARRRTRN